MKNVISGVLKKANNKESQITVVNNIAVETVALGKFKPGKGEFFDSVASLVTANPELEGQEFKLAENITAVYTAPDADGVAYIALKDNTIEVEVPECPEPVDVIEGDDVVEVPEPEAPEAAIVEPNDILVIEFVPHIKKDGTFTQFDECIVYSNLALTLPAKFKSKAITSLIAE